MKNTNNRTGRKTNSSKPWAPKPEVQKKQKSPYSYSEIPLLTRLRLM